ncbi:uncharacterized protein TM35_000021050 [Trypanosoma theileri]|uniref:RanBP2-type domain-containing protein n=1 Tax=Trypanosoma theileri TaxID=67003 RepID=A0A1X0P869_9TRYP|nr:uncharacterized protein TM35_000021050 [Trypanosoma theileri]ORC92779.1 hypothetical protein TM35_000021050 [Trypanosoma theileri]
MEASTWNCSQCTRANRADCTMCAFCGGTSASAAAPSVLSPQAASLSLLDELFSITTEATATTHGGGGAEQENAQEHMGSTLPSQDLKDDFFLQFYENGTTSDDSGHCDASRIVTIEQLYERRMLIENLLSDGVARWYEVSILLQRFCSILELDKPQIQEVNQPFGDHSLTTLTNAESMERCYLDFLCTSPFVEFLQTFKHVSVFPTLTTLPLVESLYQCVQEWVEGQNGLCVVLSNLSLVKELQLLIQAISDKFASAVLNSARSVYEALLLSALTDICRYCIQLMCTSIPHDLYPFSGRTLKSVVHHNSIIISHVDKELQNYQKMLQLLNMARSTAYHKCSEDIQANVSPLIAELLSIFDMFSLAPVLSIDKHKTEENRCKLSGLKLNSSNHYEGEVEVDNFVSRYWKETMGLPLPL